MFFPHTHYLLIYRVEGIIALLYWKKLPCFICLFLGGVCFRIFILRMVTPVSSFLGRKAYLPSPWRRFWHLPMQVQQADHGLIVHSDPQPLLRHKQPDRVLMPRNITRSTKKLDTDQARAASSRNSRTRMPKDLWKGEEYQVSYLQQRNLGTSPNLQGAQLLWTFEWKSKCDPSVSNSFSEAEQRGSLNQKGLKK